MDLSILQKVNELVEQGRDVEEIRHELQIQGIPPETVSEALKEAGPKITEQPPAQAGPAPTVEHHEKIIQPTPGFDPTAK